MKADRGHFWGKENRRNQKLDLQLCPSSFVCLFLDTIGLSKNRGTPRDPSPDPVNLRGSWEAVGHKRNSCSMLSVLLASREPGSG